MSETILVMLAALGRTTLWLAALALGIALVLRIARPSSPTAHRAAWLLALLVGWTFVRVPLAVPWYEVVSVESAALEQLAPSVPPTTFENEALDAAPPQPAEDFAEPAQPFDPPTEAEPSPRAWKFDWPRAALSAWALGMAALMTAWIFGYARFSRSLGSRDVADEDDQTQWRELLAAAGVRQQIPLCVTEELGPLLCRLPRGYVLVVPERLWRSLDSCERRAILRHELAHYQRGDVWKSLVARLLALPHWFNPASWWAVRRFDEAAEWACDRAAAGDEAVTEYARLLVRLGEVASSATVYGSAARGRPLAARIRRILMGPTKEDSNMKKIALIAVALCLSGASLVQLRLVAQQPASRDDAADAKPPAPRRNSETLNAPTVRPDLNLLQDRSADDAPAAGPAEDPFSSPPDSEPADDAPAAEDPFAGPPVAPPADAKTGQKMVDEARATYEATQAAYFADNASFQQVYDWSRRWMEAAQRVASSEEQRIAAAQGHLDRMRDQQKRIAALSKLQTRGGEEKYLRAVNYYVAEAERNLAEVETAKLGALTRQSRPQDKVGSEVQVVDLKIKISEMNGQLDQTKLDLETAQEARDVAAQAARISPGTVSRVELARLNIAPQKLKRELQSLKEQLSLYEYKLKLLTSRENAKEIQTEERAPSKSKPGAKTSSPDRSSRGKKQTRYNGKDFDTWAEELKNELSPERRAEAIRALASFGAHGLGAQATELILSNASGYTTDPRLYSRELTTAAFQAFQWIPVKDSLPALQRALKSEVESERLFAMQVVTAFHSNHADIPKLLLPMLKDPQPAVRQAAANTLLTYDPNVPELTQILREWLASDDTNQVMFAVHAITNTGQGGVNSMNRKRASDQKLLSDMMPDLLALLDRDEPIKTDVRKALLDMPDTCRPALEEAVKSENEITRRHAEAMLKEYSSRAAPPTDAAAPKK